ncbi:MAG: S8 family serine peptidase, partial [Bacteroidota bacterium]
MRRLQVQWENVPSKILYLIFILCFQLLTATAQHDYYWSNEQKITLTEDRTAVSVVFAEKQNEADLQAQMRRIKTVASFDFQASAQRLLIHFNRKVEKMEIARLLDLETEAIRHISYAQQLKDGFELWLTPKIVLALKRGRQHSDIERAFPDVPMKFSKAAFDAYTIIELAEIEDVLPLANKIKESGLVTWCHPDFYAEKAKYVDPFYADQFQLNNTGQVIDRIRGVNDIDCNAPEAWSITKGDENLIVAVIDDGVENHEDLLTASGQSRVIEGYTPYTNGNGRPNSDGAHGQSCAGIIAASHNEIGVRGIAPEVQILPINIFAGAETIAQIANAFNFARINNAAILSNSWGYSTCEGRFDAIDSAIENVVRNGRNGKGSLVTFAAGNSYADCVEYPANLETVMGVGAVTNRGLRSDYSNYGRTLDIVAPSNGAAGVRTIDRMGAEGYANGNYTGNFGGTSAACPVVSGVAALLLSAYPDLTAAQATSILLNTANDMGATGKDEEYGYGRVDAYAALLAAGGNESFGYCAAQGQSVADEWIGGFELGDYSNSSDAQTYSDFTDEIITLEAGQTYPISITPNYSGQ